MDLNVTINHTGGTRVTPIFPLILVLFPANNSSNHLPVEDVTEGVTPSIVVISNSLAQAFSPWVLADLCPSLVPFSYSVWMAWGWSCLSDETLLLPLTWNRFKPLCNRKNKSWIHLSGGGL